MSVPTKEQWAAYKDSETAMAQASMMLVRFRMKFFSPGKRVKVNGKIGIVEEPDSTCYVNQAQVRFMDGSVWWCAITDCELYPEAIGNPVAGAESGAKPEAEAAP